jgi:hypothetical protein
MALLIESCIFSEATIIKSTSSKAIFKCPIQTADDINQNNRMYPRSVLDNGMNSCRDRINRRAFYNELDHPLPTFSEQMDGIRQTTVALDRVSHILRDYEFKNNVLVGEMETTSTPVGGILFGLLKDKTGVGFSMRGLAELERLQDHSVVKDPLTIIAFDAVSLPSHKAAVVDFNEMRFEQHLLTERRNTICIGGHCFLPDYFDKLIESRRIGFFKRWI